jgi:adenylate cyclase
MNDGPRKRRRIKLWHKIALMVATLLLAVLAAATGYIIRRIHDELLNRERLLGVTYAEFLANNSEEALIGGDDLSLARFVGLVEDKPGVKYAIIMDVDGRILAHTQYRDFYGKVFQEFAGLAGRTHRAEVESFQLTAADPAFKTTKGDEGETILDIAKPVVVRFAGGPEKRIGMVRVGVSTTAIERAVSASVNRFVAAALIGVVLGVLGSLWVAGHIVKPIRRLLGGVQSIRERKYAFQIATRRNDELGDLTSSFNEMAKGLEEKEYLERNFSAYLTPQVAEMVLRDRGKAAIQGASQTISVLFVDIRGFTRLAKKADVEKRPGALVALLNDYFKMVVDTVTAYDGTVDKFLGDALLVLFGVPVPIEHYAKKAVGAALAIKGNLPRLNEVIASHDLGDIDIGIAVTSGNAIVGNVGVEGKKKEYTAIGDPVNMAQRLQTLSQNAAVIISEATHQLVKDAFLCRGPLKSDVKGQTGVVYYVVEGDSRHVTGHLHKAVSTGSSRGPLQNPAT